MSRHRTPDAERPSLGEAIRGCQHRIAASPIDQASCDIPQGATIISERKEEV